MHSVTDCDYTRVCVADLIIGEQYTRLEAWGHYYEHMMNNNTNMGTTNKLSWEGHCVSPHGRLGRIALRGGASAMVVVAVVAV